MKRLVFLVVLGLACLTSQAQQDPDLEALQLADQVLTPVAAPSNWRLFAEVALGGAILRSTDRWQDEQRMSFDLRYDNSFAPGWRGVFSDRLDVENPAQTPFDNSINTIREAYLSWQASPDLLLDLGRINERNGVALGYNPTDYFKADAVRSAVSVDPNSLKENRQGSVMAKVQKLSELGSVTLLFSPKLETTQSYADFNPDLAATNNVNRALLTISPKLSEDLNPKLLLYKADQLPAQFGLNLTSLISDAAVVYLEWSGGSTLSQLAQARQLAGVPYENDQAFRNRLAGGLTYTTANKISLTAEYDYNGRGLDQQHWDSLAASPLYGLYRYWLQSIQEAPTRRSAFFYGTWQDAVLNHLDLSAMEKLDLTDSSRLSWLEARYHIAHAEFALQWQLDSGSRFSEFGAARQAQTWAVLGRVYF